MCDTGETLGERKREDEIKMFSVVHWIKWLIAAMNQEQPINQADRGDNKKFFHSLKTFAHSKPNEKVEKKEQTNRGKTKQYILMTFVHRIKLTPPTHLTHRIT